MKNLLFVLLALNLTACASAWPKRYEFQGNETRSQAERVKDFDECLWLARTVKPSLQLHEQAACMERRGYQTVEVAQ